MKMAGRLTPYFYVPGLLFLSAIFLFTFFSCSNSQIQSTPDCPIFPPEKPRAGITVSGHSELSKDRRFSGKNFDTLVLFDNDNASLDCKGHQISGLADFGVLANKTKNVKIKNCRFSGTKDGLFAWGATNLEISNSTFDVKFRGLNLFNSTGFKLIGSSVSGPVGKPGIFGIRLRKTKDILIVENKFRGFSHGALLFGAKDFQISQNQFADLSQTGIGSMQLALRGTTSGKILNNRITGGMRAIEIQSGTTGVEIAKNIISTANVPIYIIDEYGNHRFNTVKSLTFSENQFESCGSKPFVNISPESDISGLDEFETTTQIPAFDNRMMPSPMEVPPIVSTGLKISKNMVLKKDLVFSEGKLDALITFTDNGITLDCKGHSIIGHAPYGFLIQEKSDIKITNCFLRSPYFAGLVSESKNIEITNSRFQVQSSGFHMGLSAGIKINNSFFRPENLLCPGFVCEFIKCRDVDVSNTNQMGFEQGYIFYSSQDFQVTSSLFAYINEIAVGTYPLKEEKSGKRGKILGNKVSKSTIGFKIHKGITDLLIKSNDVSDCFRSFSIVELDDSPLTNLRFVDNNFYDNQEPPGRFFTKKVSTVYGVEPMDEIWKKGLDNDKLGLQPGE